MLRQQWFVVAKQVVNPSHYTVPIVNTRGTPFLNVGRGSSFFLPLNDGVFALFLNEKVASCCFSVCAYLKRMSNACLRKLHDQEGAGKTSTVT